MKQKYLLTLLASFLAIGMLDAQIVFNSRFDNWTGNPPAPTDWNGSGNNIDTIAQISAGTAHGAYAVKLINPDPSHQRFCTGNISITASEVYEVKFWAKGRGDLRCGLHVPANTWNYNSYTTIDTTDWKEYSQTIVAPSTATDAQLIMSIRNTIQGSGDIQLDSVVMAVSTVPIPELSISTIQYTTASPADSPYDGQLVKTKGVVIDTIGGDGYYLQDGDSAWSGIFVFDYNNAPAPGDSVEVTGVVDEYFDMTQLTTVSVMTVLNSGNETVPILLPTGSVEQEKYEGCLVQVMDAECTNDDAGFGEWVVNDGSGDVNVNDNSLLNYNRLIGVDYNIVGVVAYAYSEFTMNPREDSDIGLTSGLEESQLAEGLKVLPNPMQEELKIQLKSNSSAISMKLVDALGSVVAQDVFRGMQTSVDVSHLKKGIYFLHVTDGKEQHVERLVKH